MIAVFLLPGQRQRSAPQGVVEGCDLGFLTGTEVLVRRRIEKSQSLAVLTINAADLRCPTPAHCPTLPCWHRGYIHDRNRVFTSDRQPLEKQLYMHTRLPRETSHTSQGKTLQQIEASLTATVRQVFFCTHHLPPTSI